jgi:glutathione synthase/RimK-type ligase-like ATP-grasp enzyme
VNTIGVLVPFRQRVAPSPLEQPMGRAALSLASRGARLVFGNEVSDGLFSGFEAHGDGWKPVRVSGVDVIFDRFTSHRPVSYYAGLRAELGPVPIANGLSMNTLCRDKIACQRLLLDAGLTMPFIESNPAEFASALSRWGEGFLKPRYGQCGDDIVKVRVGDSLRTHTDRQVDGEPEPYFLQAAVRPPSGWAGLSVRVLTQRAPGGAWVCNPVVLRRSASDPVANVSRGAQALPAEDVLGAGTLEAIRALAIRTCEALAGCEGGEWFIDAGVDMVIDHEQAPHLIEVNSRPWGRVKALAQGWPERFAQAHDAACRRPLEYLAWRVSQPVEGSVRR